MPVTLAAYEAALAEPPPSIVLGLLPRHAVPGISDVRSRIEAAGYEVVSFESEAPSFGARWQARVEVRFPLDDGAEGEAGTFGIRLDTYDRELAPIIEVERGHLRGILPEDAADADSAPFVIAVETQIDAAPVFAYHAQLKVLAAVALETVLFADVSSLAVRPAQWLGEAARSIAPPAPSELFTIHAVAGDGGAWLHTHGLERCGALEIETLEVPEDITGLVGHVINSTAALWMERGVPEPKAPFDVGREITLAWLPWEVALSKVSTRAAGGKQDRDESHAGPRSVLFAARKGFMRTKYEPLRSLRSILEGEPVFHVTSFETGRKMLLARERLARWTSLIERYTGTEGWTFLVKLGYTVDGASDAGEREHLWFLVHEVDGEAVDATLVNEPYAVGSLTNGARGRHDLGKLTDWAVLSPFGRFDSETILNLERRLAQPS